MNIELTTTDNHPRVIDKAIAYFSDINLSIRAKILLSSLVVIFLMVAVNAIVLLNVLQFNRKYDAMITNITTANSVSGFIKPAIDTEMWNIVAGKTEFAAGRQYAIIEQVNAQLTSMMENATSDRSRIKLEVVRRTMDTLTRYVDKMGEQIARGSRVAENEQVLDDIRGVSDVVEESIQDYMLAEVKQAEEQYRQSKQRFNRLMIAYLVLLPGAIGFSVLAAWLISASIYQPIKKLHDVTTTIAERDLRALVTSENANEITELGISFNIMIGRIRELLAAQVKEQEALQKAELKALQAQINPHFLYNTLDTIVWMAETNQTAQVIEIVRALSSFFRIALSKGKDWIPIRQELEHVRSYLHIQKMRYRDILDYEIDVDEGVLDGTILKLTLQPLVENALYHGIKQKRNGGTIRVRARLKDQDQILLEVQDDGVGCTPYRLAQIRDRLDDTAYTVAQEDEGFGLANVNRRIKLYYGSQYGLAIESQYQEGTRVTVTIPLRQDLEPQSAQGGIG
ncbi:MAG TPA: sensor histidine kinase [Anaerolineae bacterium]|nr:sensor histidine kinase [Anaerolineae bacterium]HQI87144.1 sensor histidine kinase [Anaerolineae bacterium]